MDSQEVDRLDQALNTDHLLSSNHYTSKFSLLVWGCNWILFMHRWFCPIHLIRGKSLHFEKKLQWTFLELVITMELFLNRAELSLNPLKITEAWIGLNLKTLSLHVSCWCWGQHPGPPHKRWLCGRFEPFYCNGKYFCQFSETFRKNSNNDILFVLTLLHKWSWLNFP